MNSSIRPVLVRFDIGLLKRIDLETDAQCKAAGKDYPRTDVIRDLLTEALDARCKLRDEGVPYVVPVSAAELHEESEPETLYDVSTKRGPAIIDVVVDTKKAEPAEVFGKPKTPAEEHQDMILDALAEIAAYDEIVSERRNTPLERRSSFTALGPADPQIEKFAKLMRGPDRGPICVARVVASSVELAEAFGAAPELPDGPMVSLDGWREGTTAGTVEEGASVERDASDGRSGWNHELAAAAIEEESIEVVEVGAAGGRGWLGASVRPIGV